MILQDPTTYRRGLRLWILAEYPEAVALLDRQAVLLTELAEVSAKLKGFPPFTPDGAHPRAVVYALLAERGENPTPEMVDAWIARIEAIGIG